MSSNFDSTYVGMSGKKHIDYGVPTGVVPRVNSTSENGEYVNFPTPIQKIYSSKEMKETRKHNHYFKDVSDLDTIDVYRVLALFNVTDPCLQHAVKKLLVAGGRGAKDITKDVKEAVDTCNRFLEMRQEESKNVT